MENTTTHEDQAGLQDGAATLKISHSLALAILKDCGTSLESPLVDLLSSRWPVVPLHLGDTLGRMTFHSDNTATLCVSGFFSPTSNPSGNPFLLIPELIGHRVEDLIGYEPRTWQHRDGVAFFMPKDEVLEMNVRSL